MVYWYISLQLLINMFLLIYVLFLKAFQIDQTSSLTSFLDPMTSTMEQQWERRKKIILSTERDRASFMKRLRDVSPWKLFLWFWRLQVMLFLSVAWQQTGENSWGDEWRWTRGSWEGGGERERKEKRKRWGEGGCRELGVLFFLASFHISVL